MLGFLLGGAIGYVLGSRAGRERYEQLQRICRPALHHPAVQRAAGLINTKINNVRGAQERSSEGP